MATAPVVDFQEYGLIVNAFSKVSNETLQSVGEAIVDAFKTYRFCYVKNHGVDETVVEKYLQASREFFLQPIEEKAKYKINSKLNFGWLAMEDEKLEKEVGDLHEVFKYTAMNDSQCPPPPPPPPPPVDGFETHSKKCSKGAMNWVLTILSLGLGLPTDFFTNAHKLMGEMETALLPKRFIIHPLSKKSKQDKPDWENMLIMVLSLSHSRTMLVALR